MALLNALPTDFGVDATYWNIADIAESFCAGFARVTCYGYASEDARRADKQPLVTRCFTLSGDTYVQNVDRAAAYAIIKTDPEFASATDA